jgi:hypothetical protein
MKFPKWVCSDCGKPFSRKWNGDRHIHDIHYGRSLLVPFIDYLSGRNSGLYQQTSRPLYERRGIKEVDIFTEEYSRALAREKVHQMFHPSQQHGSQNFYNYANRSFYATDLISGKKGKVFGYRVIACDNCFTPHPVEVCFSTKIEGLGRTEMTHVCTNQLASEPNIVRDKKAYLDKAGKVLPEALRTIVQAWTDNKKNLVVIEIPYRLSNNSFIKLTDEYNPGQSITINYVTEKWIELPLPEQENNYAARAIKYKTTTLNDMELEDFCKLLKDVTFAFFKVILRDSVYFYFMAIVPSQSRLKIM